MEGNEPGDRIGNRHRHDTDDERDDERAQQQVLVDRLAERGAVVLKRKGTVDRQIVLRPETVGDDDQDGQEEQGDGVKQRRRDQCQPARFLAGRPANRVAWWMRGPLLHLGARQHCHQRCPGSRRQHPGSCQRCPGSCQ
ncbi:hypothetical protein D3C72_1448940 [compost metagenome]